jgi:glyoxylate reductase
MKPTAYLINSSRGPVVDEEALLEALRTGAIAGAGLDVFEHEPKLTPGLADCPNVVMTPHVGTSTVETRIRMAKAAADAIITVFKGEVPPFLVNREVLS